MYGVYGGYDIREMGTGSADTGVTVTDSKTVDFQQFAVGAEAVSNQWSIHAYALIPTGTTEKQLNSHYEGGALDTVGVDAGYQINDKTKATAGYYHQNGDLGEADGSGASAALAYDIPTISPLASKSPMTMLLKPVSWQPSTGHSAI